MQCCWLGLQLTDFRSLGLGKFYRSLGQVWWEGGVECTTSLLMYCCLARDTCSTMYSSIGILLANSPFSSISRVAREIRRLRKSVWCIANFGAIHHFLVGVRRREVGGCGPLPRFVVCLEFPILDEFIIFVVPVRVILFDDLKQDVNAMVFIHSENLYFPAKFKAIIFNTQG